MTTIILERGSKLSFKINEFGNAKKGTIEVKLPQFKKYGSSYNKKTIFDGVELWDKYDIQSRKNDIIFGVVHSIGNRMNAWATENYYIALNVKTKEILGALRREMGWHGSYGQKVSEWKKNILEVKR